MTNNVKKAIKVLCSVVLVIAGVILGFTACAATNVIPSQTSTKQTTVVSEAKPLSAKEITATLQDAKLPISNIIVATEANDVNKLLGRPNQYISKTNFADTRIRQSDPTTPTGGTVETFNNNEDLMTRKAYIESIAKHMPAMTQYIIVNGNYMLRLDKSFTNAQVAEYKTAFMKLK